MAIPLEINKDHILQVFKKIDEEGIPSKNESRDYDLLWNDKHYPPKLVISYAHEFAKGSILDLNTFSGGKESNEFLQKLGFIIIEKTRQAKHNWLFHSNPEFWNSKLEIAENNDGYFRVSKKHEHEVKIGDEFALYVSGKEAGIYAFGTIKGEPTVTASDVERIKRYGNDSERFVTKKLRAFLNYETKLIQSPINRKDILENKVFQNNNFFINPQGVTVTNISEIEFQELKKMITTTVNYYWVNQGDTYPIGKSKECIWAPDKESKHHHHQDLKKLKKGDIIIHYSNKKIVATSVVQNEYTTATDPTGQTSDNGFYVSTRYSELENPIELTTIIRKLKNKNVLPEKYSPFNTDWRINQGYLYLFTNEAYNLLFLNDNANTASTNLIKPRYLLNKMTYVKNPNYITSLITKPFVIITGNSGTGKTRVALRLAEFLVGKNRTLSANDNNSIQKGTTFENGFYLEIMPYSINHKRIVFADIYNTQGLFPLDKDHPIQRVKLIFENKEDEARYAIYKTGRPCIYFSNEVSDWLKSIGVEKLIKVESYLDANGKVSKIILNKIDNNEIKKTSIKTYALIPVGADWTDNRNVIGFYDAINDIYRSTPILDLLLDAEANDTKPFFLILDEMNLSHVERYFADFLSAMESGKDIPLHNIAEEVLSDSQREIPQTIKLPPNVFITGTVNIDETTYMFSPKVLDRANVIEFKVTKDDINTFLNQTDFDDIADVAAEGLAESFLNLSLTMRGSIRERILADSDPVFDEKIKLVKTVLSTLFEILEGSNMEFAYRTMEEILRYMKVSFELADNKESWDWKENMDAQVLQKILPKLHGSKRKMESFLKELESICNESDFKNSKMKLDRMIKTLQTDQFVSFI